jgi:hypothetical protein
MHYQWDAQNQQTASGNGSRRYTCVSIAVSNFYEDSSQCYIRQQYHLMHTVIPFSSLSQYECGYGGVVVKAPRYKLAGRGFDSRWCHWNFSMT